MILRRKSFENIVGKGENVEWEIIRANNLVSGKGLYFWMQLPILFDLAHICQPFAFTMFGACKS